MLKAYKYRLYPSSKQKIKLLKNFKICKEIYNILLAENKELMVARKEELTLLIRDIKVTCPDYYYQPNAQVLQNVGDRLSKAFDNFFRRVKECKDGKFVKAGYPRFKSKVNSITYPQEKGNFKFIKNKLHLSKIGDVSIVLHRQLEGKVKTLTIKVNKSNQWFACFSCEVECPQPEYREEKAVGIDVGLESFATLSDENTIPNPRHLANAELKLKFLQRRLSRKAKGSHNRKKSIYRLAKQHNKVANRRLDFLHKQTTQLAKEYTFIAVEKLGIKNMVKNHCLAKHIMDAAWGCFRGLLPYKVVKYGGQLAEVSPKYSSCTCCVCGTRRDMPLSQRVFECPHCGLKLHRDLNASRIVLKDGMAGRARTYTPVDRLPTLLPIQEEASRLVEAGTIFQVGL